MYDILRKKCEKDNSKKCLYFLFSLKKATNVSLTKYLLSLPNSL